MSALNLIPITDRGDPRIAPFVGVRERDLTGGADGRFIVEGKVPLHILLTQSRFEVESLFLGESRLEPLAEILTRVPAGIPVYTAPQSLMDQVVGFPIHRGILACARKADGTSLPELLESDRLLVLNQISNHDNVGAAFRNAAAFGAEGVILDAGSCDPLYRKSIRVSSGSSLWLPYHRGGTGAEQVAALTDAGFTIWAMTPRSDAAPLHDLSPPDKLAILLGAEGSGLPDDLIEACQPVRIPMSAGFDSVNVATAGAIALSHVFRPDQGSGTKETGVSMRYIVTGGYGFIGSAVVRQLCAAGHEVFNLDSKTYAANPEAVAGCEVQNVHACITDRQAVVALFKAARPDAVIHLAAETHVDRSIDGPSAFMKTNVDGTFSLLEAALAHWQAADEPDGFRFVHVSTDEVFGDLGPDDPPFDETTSYKPSSPYSASKAASDHLARAWQRTYGLPVVVTNCTNNFGPWQNGEKLIPTVIRKAVLGAPIPIYGDGQNIRDWLYVEDHARGLIEACQAEPGATLLFGARAECSNLDLVKSICALLDELRPKTAPYAEQIEFVADRKGHDRRYGVDPSSAERAVGWSPRQSFEEALRRTVQWYLETLPVDLKDSDDRLGLARA